MKKFLLIVLVLGFKFMSYGQVNESAISEEYEYMTIISEFPDKLIYLVYITEPDGKYEKIILDDRKKFDKGETTFLFDLLSKYSKQGWVLESNNMSVNGGAYCFYFLLKRKIKK